MDIKADKTDTNLIEKQNEWTKWTGNDQTDIKWTNGLQNQF